MPSLRRFRGFALRHRHRQRWMGLSWGDAPTVVVALPTVVEDWGRLYGHIARFPYRYAPKTSRTSAITCNCPSSAPLRTMGPKSGLMGFRTIFVWRQESPSLAFSLS